MMPIFPKESYITPENTPRERPPPPAPKKPKMPSYFHEQTKSN